MDVHGLVLAAGAGRRYGGPKALVDGWLAHAVEALRDGGCAEVTVVLGAAAEQVVVPAGVASVVASDWAQGMGASLRAGLGALGADAVAAVVTLVDLPDVDGSVVRRLLLDDAVTVETLRRAAYDAKPGHPVVIGRAHWEGVAAAAHGDQGARAYLAGRTVDLVDCGDLASGADVDRRGAR